MGKSRRLIHATDRQLGYIEDLVRKLGWEDRVCADPPTTVEMTAGFIKALIWAERISRSCAATKKDGSRCFSVRKNDSRFCGWHDKFDYSALPAVVREEGETLFHIRYKACPN